MSSTLSVTQSEFSAGRWAPSVDPALRPADIKNDQFPSKQLSRGKRASRYLAGFLTTSCIGAAATWAWQSQGDAARETIQNLSPQLGWLVPHAAPVAQTASA